MIMVLIDFLKFEGTFTPYQNIATDESLLKFHGRLRFKQYNPSKNAWFGIKVNKVFQSSSPAADYTWNLKIYCGQDRTDDGLPASIKVVLDVNNQLLGKGYNIYLDNSSFPALVYLFSYYKQKQTFAA